MDVDQIGEHKEEQLLLNTMAGTDILSEQDLAQIFDKHPESVKRAIKRGELPESVQLFKERVWTVGAIRQFLENRLLKAQKERDTDVLRLNRYGT